MNKEERGEQLALLLSEFESATNPKERFRVLDKILDCGYKYNADYVRPYLHPFMGSKVPITNLLLDTLNKLKQLTND